MKEKNKSASHLLIENLKSLPKTFFSLTDIKKFYKGNLRSLPVLISRMIKKGILKRIIKGYFTFDLNKVDFEEFACTYKKPSYISNEYALYHYGLIDQVPETITMVTLGKSQTLNTTGKIIEYSHINKNLFFGYEILGNILIASKEKALLDEIYLISLKKRSLNVKKEWLKEIDKTKFNQWIKKYPNYTKKYLDNKHSLRGVERA